MKKKGSTAQKKSPAGKHEGWLKVCPNCGYQPKAVHIEKKIPGRVKCPICFYHGPQIEVRAEDYAGIRFAHQKIPERDEGNMVLPEILLILILSALMAILLWKAARGIA